MDVSFSDLTSAAELAQKLDPNPVSLAGRIVGLSAEERKNVPAWAWYAAAGVLAVGICAVGVKMLSRSARG